MPALTVSAMGLAVMATGVVLISVWAPPADDRAQGKAGDPAAAAGDVAGLGL